MLLAEFNIPSIDPINADIATMMFKSENLPTSLANSFVSKNDFGQDSIRQILFWKRLMVVLLNGVRLRKSVTKPSIDVMDRRFRTV